MLVLKRNIGETVVIGEETYFTVLGVKGNQVRIGIDAPESTTINRKEIHDRIALENEDALYMDTDKALLALPVHELISRVKSLEQEGSTTH